MTRILVVGGTGFIGPPTVRRLADLGHEVTVYHRGEHEPDLPAAVRHIHSPLAKRPVREFPDEVRESAPDVVLHMTLLGEDDARAVMAAFRGSAGRIVAVSSADVYRAYDVLRGVEAGPPEPVPLSEESRLREKLFPYRGEIEGLNDYDKILAERVVLDDSALPGTILRLPMVYGSGDNQHRFGSYVRRIDDGRPAILMGEREAAWRSCWGYVENVAEAIALACSDDRATGQTYNVAEKESPSLGEWVRAIADATGWTGRVMTVPDDRLPGAGEHQYRWEQDLMLDSTRIRQELGYGEVVDRVEGLRRTIDWERANPVSGDGPDYAAEDEVLAGAAAIDR